jgi:hypothetical protein
MTMRELLGAFREHNSGGDFRDDAVLDAEPGGFGVSSLSKTS